ncbi:MAG TPA: hypothetical protein VLT36_11360, partial [Candidatus Dormibacteraeota bacterium]|nr:hypothetical protein [Candidatus Dormibacteraeota bacterium]
MNPPPSPTNPKPQKGFAYYAVLGSQWAAMLVCLMFTYQAVTVPHTSSMPVVGKPAFCVVLSLAGLILGILSICYVKPGSPPRTRLWGIVSVAGNCLLLFLLAVGFSQGIKNRRNAQRIIAALKEESRNQEQTLARLYEERTNLIRTTADLSEATTNLMSDLRGTFNPRTGLTNVNLQAVQQVRERLNQAGQQLPGDAGVVARIMSINLDAMATRSQNLQASGQRVQEAHIEQGYGVATSGQIADRRKLLYDFLAANSALASAISNKESDIMTMLQSSNVSPKFIEIGRQQLSRSRHQRELMLQIRAYDQQQGEDFLGILDLLEKDWGIWHSDPTNKTVNFDNEASRLGYLQHRQSLQDASA